MNFHSSNIIIKVILYIGVFYIQSLLIITITMSIHLHVSKIKIHYVCKRVKLCHLFSWFPVNVVSFEIKSIYTYCFVVS